MFMAQPSMRHRYLAALNPVVLEINGGLADRLGMVGDQMQHISFGNDAIWLTN
jgi:hypothetical protein